MSAYKQISVFGPIASGKTTTAKRLGAALGAQYFDADAFTANPFLADYARDIPRWALATELKFVHERVGRAREIPKMLQKGHVVTDSGLLMGVEVFARRHLQRGTMTNAEWNLFFALTTEMTRGVSRPDAVVFLDLAPEEQLRRIALRGRDFERAYTLDYLIGITNACLSLALRLIDDGVKVFSIDTLETDVRDDAAIAIIAKRILACGDGESEFVKQESHETDITKGEPTCQPVP